MNKTKEQPLIDKVEWLRDQTKQSFDPYQFAEKSGVEFNEREGDRFFEFRFFNQQIKLTYPCFQAKDSNSNEILPVAIQAVIAYYLYSFTKNITKTTLSGWISFSELEDGRIYERAFQGYTGNLLSKHAHNILISKNNFKSLNPTKLTLGDYSFSVEVLPGIFLALVVWLGDEDFPSSCRILFSEDINNILPTDACAIVGSMFTKRVLSNLKVANV